MQPHEIEQCKQLQDKINRVRERLVNQPSDISIEDKKIWDAISRRLERLASIDPDECKQQDYNVFKEGLTENVRETESGVQSDQIKEILRVALTDALNVLNQIT